MRPVSDLQFVVILPRRRVTTVAAAEAAIVEACQAKTAILAALASLEPAPAAPGEVAREAQPVQPQGRGPEIGAEELNQRTEHMTRSQLARLLQYAGAYSPKALRYALEDAEQRAPWFAQAAESAVVAPCTEPAPANHPAACARLEGHRPPHRDLGGFEWGDVEPHHAGHGEMMCQAYADRTGEGWLCTAQAGHGGPDHITYGAGDEIAYRWPVDDGTAMRTAPCGCPEADGQIRHQRGTCTDPVVDSLGWYASERVLPAPKPSGMQAPRPVLRVLGADDDEPDDVAAEVVRDMLLLVSVEIPLDVVAAWTPYQRREAADWAGIEHLHASDNDVERLPKPECVTAAQAASLVGRLVEDAHDDSPVPTVGLVVGQVDDETLDVAWGAQRSAANPLTHHEPFDALRPAREASQP